MGSRKPWLARHAKNPPADVAKMEDAKNTKELWYHVLRKVIKDHDLGIDVNRINVGKPTLGMFPTNAMVMQSNEARSEEKS